ncbi:MAG: hypothetical protein WCK90_01630 [archaeon]
MRDTRTDQVGAAEAGAQAGPAVDMPIVGYARTGLSGRSDAVTNKMPADYATKTVGDAIQYLVGGELSDKDRRQAESISNELGARGRVVVVNGRTAQLTDRLADYLVEKAHELPNGQRVPYRELDIEISGVQQGGLYRLLN